MAENLNKTGVEKTVEHAEEHEKEQESSSEESEIDSLDSRAEEKKKG